MIHKHSYYLEKEDFAKEISLLDSLKKQHIDEMMPQLRANQNAFFRLTKQYTQSTRACLTLLKSIKRTSIEQHDEDRFYAQIIVEYVNNVPKFKNYSEVYPTSQKELARSLRIQNKKIEKIRSRLKKESKTENYRYQLYDDFLKGRRVGDNIRVKSIQNQLNKYKIAVDKGIKRKQQIDETNL
jgi:hypothetical protein